MTAHFLHEYTDAHAAALRATAYLVWDLETTGLTPASRPVAVGGTALIGHQTYKAYKALTGATLDCRLRPRISTVYLDDGSILAWDLDALPPEVRKQLILDTVHEQVIVGHNLTFDLIWAMAVCGQWIEPAFVVDTLLLTRCLRPGLTWDAHLRAAGGDLACIDVVTAGDKNASVALAALAAGQGLGKMDKAYQHPRNWCVSVLSKGHFAYVVGDVQTPLLLLQRILRLRPVDMSSWQNVMNHLVEIDSGFGGGYMRVYSKVPVTLARMSTRGMPVHMDTLDAIEMHRISLIPGIVERVVEAIPALGAHLPRLLSTQMGVPVEVKYVLAAYAAEHGITLDNGIDGAPIIKSSAVQINGAGALPGWQIWNELQAAKKVAGLCSEYRGISLPGECPGFKQLHPLLGAITTTLRVKSSVPNVQNLPRPAKGLPDELQFRSVVRAPEGHVIVSADYGQIELRIAAALALRAVSEAQELLARDDEAIPRWVRDAMRRGEDLLCELHPDAEGFEGVADGVANAWRQVGGRGALMAEAFRAGVDPHLLTGLGMAVKQGLIEIVGTPLVYLKGLSKDDESALKKSLAPQRQAAKPLNFGLLYGMQAPGLWALGISDYGMTWDLSTATQARADWFEMYPEIAFWQCWTRFVSLQPKREARAMLVRDDYTKKLKRDDVRLGVSYTLAGRPVCGHLPREIGNHSDQGTGADIMLEAIVNLDAPYKHYVMNTIHDEVMLLVPEALASAAKSALQASMLKAADRVLSPWGIPAEAEPSQSTFWTNN